MPSSTLCRSSEQPGPAGKPVVLVPVTLSPVSLVASVAALVLVEPGPPLVGAVVVVVLAVVVGVVSLSLPERLVGAVVAVPVSVAPVLPRPPSSPQAQSACGRVKRARSGRGRRRIGVMGGPAERVTISQTLRM